MADTTNAEKIDVDVDEIDPKDMWTPEERETYFKEMEEPPLLMDHFTDEDRRTNTNYLALESIIHDNRSDMEMVEDFQHEGKCSFAKGKVMFSKAYSQFKKAIFYGERMEKTQDNLHIVATLYGNCALIQMMKENYRTCVNDCNKALEIEPRYKKVLYRKGKSLAGLNDYSAAVDCCNIILEDEPDNIYTLRLKEECEKHIVKDSKRSEEIAISQQKKEAERQLSLKTIADRNYRYGPSLYEYPERFNASICVKNDELVFPVLILYPETSSSDYVREMSESDTFTDVFYMLFPATNNHNSYLDWDEEKQYRVDNVEVWMQENMILPYPKEGTADVESLRHHFLKQRWIRINQNFTLGDALRYQNYVIPGIPVFHIYAKNSCRMDFIKSQDKELWHLVGPDVTRPIHRCQHCGNYESDIEEFKKCSRCKKTYYCSRECQVSDWKTHKNNCKLLSV